MQFSVGVENAFHSLFYMINMPMHKTIGIRDIAKLHGIGETYLSKVFSKLQKAGIVKSVPGVKGGYVLAKAADDISFWDIIEAIEGPSYLFRCAEIRKKNIFVDNPNLFTDTCPCLIKTVIQEAEELMRNELRAKSLLWLHDNVYKGFPNKKQKAIEAWLEKI
ncbi:MAG: Rrf2 family transcriptional regulator [Thermodesulfovibrio sp.]|nr:Rrf2 family transcriptional regulator [Thermodesulfovibrio sp.]